MQIQMVDADIYMKWRKGIEGLLDESASINFPDSQIDKNYAKDRCDDLYEYLKEGKAVVFVAADNDELMGFIWCHPINRHLKKRIHIAEIAVVGRYRKSGVGGRLLKAVEEYASENGFKEIDLFVTLANKDAVSFYEKNLFVPERTLMKKKI